MDVIVKCMYCGKSFLAHSRKAMYCSKKCKDIVFRTNHGIPCNANVEPYKKTCIICGKNFDTFRKTRVTCSSECAQKKNAPNGNGTTKKIDLIEFIKNNKDGFDYVEKSGRRVSLKCRKCGGIIVRDRKTILRYNTECEHCKEIEKHKEAVQKLTSFLNALALSKTPRKCEKCGKEFLSEYATQKYCSKKCGQKARGKKKSVRSRCKKYGALYDGNVTRAKVLKRDNYTCQICGKECNPADIRWGTSGPDYPTVDHIIPLAKGGAHIWSNVQCACGICNSYKRDLLGYEVPC